MTEDETLGGCSGAENHARENAALRLQLVVTRHVLGRLAERTQSLLREWAKLLRGSMLSALGILLSTGGIIYQTDRLPGAHAYYSLVLAWFSLVTFVVILAGLTWMLHLNALRRGQLQESKAENELALEMLTAVQA